MALVIGTNCGFVATAPTADPAASAGNCENLHQGMKVTSPATATKVTEIGFYMSYARAAVNAQVGLYDHDAANDRPKNLLGFAEFSKGTTAGWKKATLDITITPNTIYWIAVQIDYSAAGNEETDYASSATQKVNYDYPSTELPSTWGVGNAGTELESYYAVWEAAAAGTNTQINIGDSWKAIAGMQINIGDAWKAVAGAKINIGDAWKTIF